MTPSLTLNIYKAVASKSIWPIQKKIGEKQCRLAGGKSSCNFLFIYYLQPIAESQYYPFYHYRKAIEKRYNKRIKHISLPLFQEHINGVYPDMQQVCIQTNFDLTVEGAGELFGKIKRCFPNAKIIFYDWFAPTDIRLAQTLDPYIDFYVKKNCLNHFDDYGLEHSGDTNLMDYYGKLYGLDQPRTSHPVPNGFEKKLVVGPNFITAAQLMPLFQSPMQINQNNRPIDLHARLGSKGTQWYQLMRQASIKTVGELKLENAVSKGMLNFRKYLQEIARSKMTFSPFGYGEVCWRDYEAAALGSMLIKPDMSHIITEPNIFIPNETYVPIRWDFSDLKEKVDYYLAHDQERNRIAQNAYDVVYQYYQNNAFFNHVEAII